MTADRPHLLLIVEEPSLSQAWIDACRADAVLGEPLALEAAARFLHALAAELGGGSKPDASPGPNFEQACRTFAWATGSGERAVRQLAALRLAVQNVFAGAAPTARNQVDRLLDAAIVAVVHHNTEVLSRDALVDPATGLLNRRALVRDLERELSRTTRSGVGFCLVLIDAGRHGRRDIVIEVVDALAGVLRRGDTAYRAGDGEVAVVLHGAAAESVDRLFERLDAAGAPPLSWGAAVAPGDWLSADALLREASAHLAGRRLDPTG